MTMFFDPFRELDRVASSMLDQRQSLVQIAIARLGHGEAAKKVGIAGCVGEFRQGQGVYPGLSDRFSAPARDVRSETACSTGNPWRVCAHLDLSFRCAN